MHEACIRNAERLAVQNKDSGVVTEDSAWELHFQYLLSPSPPIPKQDYPFSILYNSWLIYKNKKNSEGTTIVPCSEDKEVKAAMS
uniref:Uncharacterized protein n=1 Tax=Anguilla anguilla TaxID=7936 RepID=A0A0E9X8V2_ANGAN